MVSTTRGLNNVTDPLRLSVEWLVQADNVNVTDTGGIVRRDGYARAFPGTFTGAFSTFDYARMYLVDGGALKAMTDKTTATTLSTGLASAQMHWTETNDQVFFNNGIDSGVILRDNTVLPWRWPVPGASTLAPVTGQLAPGVYQVKCVFEMLDGRLTGAGPSAEITLGVGEALRITDVPQAAGYLTRVYIAPADSQIYQLAGTSSGVMTWNDGPDSLGTELLDTFTDPLPADTSVVQAWRGRIYAAQHFPSAGDSVVWFSQPLGFHLFNLNEDFIAIPGKVLMLAPHDGGLVIGTDQRVFVYDGKALDEVAQYGVAPGWHWATDTDGGKSRLLFWSTRGLCSGLPFTNLTERQVSLAPGLSAGGTVVLAEGQRRYVVALKQGGTAFNPRS